MKKIAIILAALLVLSLSAVAMAENQYYSVASPVEITGAETYTLTLDAGEGWMFNITDNMDVTSWLVKANGEKAFADESGIATTKLVWGPVEGEEADVAVSCEVIIDASKITGFNNNGSYDLYVLPTGKSTIWVTGENHGQYVDTAEPAGKVVIPAVSVNGKLTGSAGMELAPEQDTVQIVLTMDGLDDALIDSSAAVVELLEGDGYKTTEVEMGEGTLSAEWKDGAADYTMGSFKGVFSPQGGDGNGHYDFRIGVGGLTYNGLPLSEAVIRTDFYSFGRTFDVTGGSIILNTEPIFTADAEIPVICDAYPDVFTAEWPVAMDASAVTGDQVRVVLTSKYGDELVLESGKDYTVASDATRTTVTLNYIYWAYAPVYTTLTVEIDTSTLVYDELMYAPTPTFSHTYDIASVYIYSVMSGGPTGTQAWTFFGIKNLTDPLQVFKMATYTLTVTDENGDSWFYGEDENGNGVLVSEQANAVAFPCNEECNVRIENDTLYYERLYDQTEEKTVNGETITFAKSYYTAETLPLATSELDVELEPGYAIGESWEDHLKWPWQTFIGTGYQGGTK